MIKEKTPKDRFMFYAWLILGYFSGQHSHGFKGFFILTIIFLFDMALGTFIGRKINEFINEKQKNGEIKWLRKY